MASKYDVDDLVWAKMRGYPPWPARVVPPPPRKTRPMATKPYFVFFYGTHEIGWMAAKDMQPYSDYQEVYKKQAHRLGLSEAILEIEEDPLLVKSDDRHLLEDLMKPKIKGGGRMRKNNSVHTSPAIGRKRKSDKAPTQGGKSDHIGSEVMDNDVATPQTKRKRTLPVDEPATNHDILSLADSLPGDAVFGNGPTLVTMKTEPLDESLAKTSEDRSLASVEGPRVEPATCRRSSRLKQTSLVFEPVQVPPMMKRRRRKSVAASQSSVHPNKRNIAHTRPTQATVDDCSTSDLRSTTAGNWVNPKDGESRSPEQTVVKRLTVPHPESMEGLVPQPESIVSLPISLLWPETIGLIASKSRQISHTHSQQKEAASLGTTSQAQSPPSQSQSTHPAPPSQPDMPQSSPSNRSSEQNKFPLAQPIPISTSTILPSEVRNKVSPVQTPSRVTSQNTPNATPLIHSSEPQSKIFPAAPIICQTSQSQPLQSPSTLQLSVSSCKPASANTIVDFSDSQNHPTCSTATVQQASLAASIVQLADSLVKSTQDNTSKSMAELQSRVSPVKPILIHIASETSPVIHLAEPQGKSSPAKSSVRLAETSSEPPSQERPVVQLAGSCSDLSSQARPAVQLAAPCSDAPSQTMPIVKLLVAQSSPPKACPYQTRRRHDPSSTSRVSYVEQLTARYSARQQGWSKRSEGKSSVDTTDLGRRKERLLERTQGSHEQDAEEKMDKEMSSSVATTRDTESTSSFQDMPGRSEVQIVMVRLDEGGKEMEPHPQRTVMEGEKFAAAEKIDAQSGGMSEQGSDMVMTRPTSPADHTNTKEYVASAIMSNSVQQQPQFLEATSHDCSRSVGTVSLPEEPSKRDSSSKTSGVLLMAGEARPLIPQTHAVSLVDVPSAEGSELALICPEKYEAVQSSNSQTLQKENGEHKSTEDVSDDKAAGSEPEHSEFKLQTDAASKPKLNRPPPVFPIRSSMNIVDALKLFNCNIKTSLVLQHTDTQQTLKQLRDLLELNFGKEDIQQVPDLVSTLRKARMFKSNSRVKTRADEAYCKIKGLYLNGVIQPRRRGPKKTSITPKPGRGRGRPATRKRPQSIVSMINEKTSVKSRMNLSGQEPAASTESTDSMSNLLSSSDVLATKDSVSCAQDGSYSNAVADEPSTHGEPHSMAENEESPCRRSQRQSARSRVNYNEMAGGDSENQNSDSDDQIVPQL